MPSMHKIAAAKAKAFDKELFTHGHDAAFELGIVNKPNKKTIFYVPGSATSSFLCLTIMHRVHTKAAAARRLYAGNTRVGKAIRALWELGPEKINSMALQKASMNLNREEIRTLRLAAFRVPWWLAKYTNFVATIAGQVVY